MSDRWRSPSGKIHQRRRRWYAGTPDERVADDAMNIMLCGQRRTLEVVPDDTEITCMTCFNTHKANKEA